MSFDFYLPAEPVEIIPHEKKVKDLEINPLIKIKTNNLNGENLPIDEAAPAIKEIEELAHEHNRRTLGSMHYTEEGEIIASASLVIGHRQHLLKVMLVGTFGNKVNVVLDTGELITD